MTRDESVGPRIPNYSTLSTLIDRLSIENVKLAHFENTMEHDNLSPQEASGFQMKIDVQVKVIDALRQELTRLLKEAILSGNYEFLKEERTFK